MSLTNEEIIELERLIRQDDLFEFTKATFDKFKPEWFHKTFYDILNRFAKKEIPNLIVSMPPQHGKSEGSTRRLPAFIAGTRPDEKMAIVSYSATKAQKFGREIINIIREPSYRNIFPHVAYPDRGSTMAKANTNMERESLNSDGSMKFVGVDGPLTGDPVDILILDDLYKGWKDGNSPVTQKAVWDWYITVSDSRLHNDSQVLITFTRWSESDLIAMLDEKGFVVHYDGTENLDDVIANLDHGQFLMINFQAIKEGKPNDIDPREEGEALWPARHSLKKLEATRAKDPDKFDCLYQGDPQNKEGMMYPKEFKTWSKLPELRIIKNYTDTADSGDNYLCSMVYGVPLNDADKHFYILDWVYSDKGMDVTEPMTANLLKRNRVRKAHIESNNGGRGFYRNVKALVNDPKVEYDAFHQSDNKEARVFSNSATVNSSIVFPSDWHIKDPVLYKHITKFKKLFKANDFDDAPDVLTGIIEKETLGNEVHETTVNADELGLL